MASASKQITEPFLSQVERVREEMRAKFLRTHQILQQREAALTSELDQLVANYRVEKIKEQMQDLDRMKDALKSTVQCEENKEIVEKSVVLMKKRRKELEVSLETLLDEMWGVELDWEEELEGRLLEIGEIKVIAAPALIHEKERITGSTYADELDMKIRGDPPSCMTHGPNTSAKKQELVNVLTREPEEIIMVLLDTSGSMLEVYFDGKSKFTSVIEAFTEFSDLSRAYNFKHVIGLTYIRHIPKLKFPLSENFYEFVNHFTNLEAEGRTSIYDAIYYAINCLNTFKIRNSIAKYANRRIICLTDGEDNRSRVEPNEVVELLIKNNIIMDTVLLCKEKVFSHFIAKASGGYSFQPKSSKELMQIFGQEPMLTMAIRKSKKPQISAQKCESINLKKLKLGFDTKPEHRVPDKLKEKAILPELYLAQAFKS